MNTRRGLWATSALLLVFAVPAGAQETLGGMAAAGAAGATLGAAGAGALSSGRMTRNLPPGSAGAMDMNDPSTMSGGPGAASGMGRGGPGAAAAPAAARPAPPELYGGSGSDFVNELMAAPVPSQRSVSRHRRSPRAQARYAARVARMGRRARTRRVMAKYHIAPRGWEAAYLPQDRYKFGKVWKYVSTEYDRFYYTPSGMALKRFNPNRVIGFASYEDALLAGYRPDPVTRPAPGAQIAYLARLTRGPELNSFVEYVYSGQMSPDAISAVYSYAQTVDRTLRPTRARAYIGSTVAKVLDAALTGDTSGIPTQFTESGPVVTTTTTTTVMGGPQFPGGAGGPPPGFVPPPGGGQSSPADTSGGDQRTDAFNNFSNRAGSLANVPANQGR